MTTDKEESLQHSCTLNKELENKIRVLAVEQSMSICDVTRGAIGEYVERERVRRERRLGLINSNDPLCKQT